MLTVALWCADDLDTLTDWVVELFSLVQSKGLMPVSFAPDPFGPELLGTFTYQKTVKDFLAMELAWPIPDQTELYHSKVCPFLHLHHESHRCSDRDVLPDYFL